jgi:NAD(P)-dependent dehydrogenase (short-subunit alcohol dehydrogenase family)
MKMLSKMMGLSSRLIRTVKAVRQCWKAGGVTQVNIAQINYGGILKGKRVLITGGSAGIGLAIARKCLSEGATVIITGRTEANLKAAEAELNNPLLKTLVWDVSQIALQDEKLDEALQLAGGGLDVLVNNAGILGGNRQLIDLTEEFWEQIFSVNAKGLVFLTQRLVKKWIQCKQCGKIINMSSMRGTLGVQDGPYGMSKWGLNGLTHGLGLKLAPHGIIVNGIAPGIIDTGSIAIKNMDARENAYLAGIPVSRIGLPEEIAELAVFLMSDAANYIVGQTILCDGGYTLKV